MCTNAKKLNKKLWRHVVSSASFIYEVKPEHSRLKPYGNSWRSCHVIQIFSELETSLLMRGIQIGEMSKLGWLIGLTKHAIWADSLYFLYLLLLSISKTLASPHPTLWPSSYACCANFDFSRRPCWRLCLCSRSRTARCLPVSPI
jgi:hypothetical protein